MAVLVKNRPWSRRLQNRRSRAIYGPSFKVVSNGDVINDASRTLGIQGDGRTVPDSSYGLWRASTNLIANGGFESNPIGWTNLTGTSSANHQKFGTKSGRGSSILAGNSSTASYQEVAVSPSTSYAASCWGLIETADAGSTVQLSIQWLDASHVSISTVSGVATQQTGSYDWLPLVLVDVSPPNAAFAVFKITWHNASSGSASGYIDGVQLEQQPYATPYIETNGATAARAAGYVTAPIRVVNGTQSWIALRCRPEWISSDGITHSIIDDPTVTLGGRKTGGSTWLLQRGGNSAEVAASHVAGDYITLIFKWTGTNISISLNGSAFVNTTDSSAQTLTTLNIGYDIFSAWSADSEFLWVAAGTGTLSDADAATIHAKGNTDDPTNWPSLSAATFFWAASDDSWVVPTLAVGFNYTDSATITSKTIPSATETANFVDAATISGTTVLTAVETAQDVDSATITGSTIPSSTEVHEIPDSSTVTGTTVVTTSDLLAAVEAATIIGVSSLTSTEITQYVEAATLTGTTIVSSTELHEIPDADTVTGTTVVTTQDLLAAIEAATISGTTVPISDDIAAYDDVSSITGATVLTAVEVAAYVEQDTITGITFLDSTEIYQPGGVENTDADTITGTTILLSTETAQYVDAETGATTTVVTSNELSDYVDADSITTITSLISVDVFAAVDAASVTGVTTPISTEVHEIPDSNTITGTSIVTTLDVAAYTDADSISGTTIITYIEDSPGDSNTIPGTTIPSATDVAAFVDSISITGSTILTTTEAFGAIDTATTTTSTVVTFSDTYGAIDLNTVVSSTSLISADIVQDADNNTVPSSTTPSSSDIAADVESATLTSTTIPSADEVSGQTFIDSNTPTTTTQLTYVERADYAETTSVVTSTTSTTSTETTEAIDAATPRSTTVVFSTETQGFGNIDLETITTTTYITPLVEIYRFVAVELVGVLHRRWLIGGIEPRWTTPVQGFRLKWAGVATIDQLTATIRRRWLSLLH